jgi:hypothetical protein
LIGLGLQYRLWAYISEAGRQNHGEMDFDEALISRFLDQGRASIATSLDGSLAGRGFNPVRVVA